MDIDQDPIPLQKDCDDLVRLISEVAIGNGSKELKIARLELLFEELEIVKAALELVQWISDIATGRDDSTEPKEKRLELSLKELDRLKAELRKVRSKRAELKR